MGEVVATAIVVLPNLEHPSQGFGVPLMGFGIAATRTALAAHVVRNEPPDLGSFFRGHVLLSLFLLMTGLQQGFDH